MFASQSSGTCGRVSGCVTLPVIWENGSEGGKEKQSGNEVRKQRDKLSGPEREKQVGTFFVRLPVSVSVYACRFV